MDQHRFDGNPNLDRHQNGNSIPDPDRFQNDADPQNWRCSKMVRYLDSTTIISFMGTQM
jgi:hypothetical protein